MSLPRYTNTLVVRLVGFGVVLALIGTIARYFILTDYLRNNLIEVTSAQQSTLAKAAAHDITYKLTERLHFLNRIAHTLPLELLQNPKRLHNWLQERAELQPLFSLGLMVTNIQGIVTADTASVPGRVGRSLAANPDFQQVLKGKSGIGAPLIGQLTHQPLLPMGVPVTDHAGTVRAVLIGVTALSAPDFLSFLNHGHQEAAGHFYLVSPHDRLIMDFSTPEVTLKPIPPIETGGLLDRALGGFRGSGITRSAQGIESIAAIASVPSTGWFVMAEVPTSVALDAVARTKSYILWHLLLILLIALPAIAGYVIWVLRPLYRAAEKAEKMSRGEIPLYPLPVARQDEVGHLTTAFNHLLTKLTDSQANLEHLAYHDTLTGLPNRSLLIDRMRQVRARARRHGSQLAVLFLDLDGFKQINDTLGHDAGDEVLRAIAQRLSGVVRQADTLARIGGDEFVLLVTDLTPSSQQSVDVIAVKCIQAVAEPLRVQGVACQIGVSIGVALCNGRCAPECLLREADKAMYAAKQQGRGSYRVTTGCADNEPEIATKPSEHIPQAK